LEEREFVSVRRDTGTRVPVYRLTDTGRLWLDGCRRVEPDTKPDREAEAGDVAP
jgi:DNA-binding PadR family transcriptional regulator